METTATQAIEEGQKAPDFKLASSKGPVELGSFRGDKNVLVYFMREFSCAVCRGHVKELGRMYPELQAQGVEVVVVGGGELPAGQRLAETFKLPFAVASDPDRGIYHRYGLDKAAGVIQRSGSILVDQQGNVRYIQRATLPTGALDKAELQTAIAGLNR